MWLEVAVIVLAVLQAIAIVLLWQQGLRLKRALAGKETEAGGVPALMMVNALNKIDHRLSLLETRAPQADAPVKRSLEVPAVQMTSLRTTHHHASSSNYELAQHLAREGGDLEQLMERCGLSRNEAELVLRLYAKRA
ncbi:DUF2802 domain-containing protein [Dyella mobilis]|uniref:DUF2802 domain-containing protein n=1 Tax=Dyella mobilis TaxID=1849582 RepID=A0ABS2KAU8_9GAMM|nr:DUF2802 domain-containing protein [Dyella mobilis]MBM7128074.1 DUF2802 domain-containing protein [Dyella mobilis]GLQ99887.1 hypothetical protein GCM10007863_43070 [Dyella mobilis]